MNLEVINPITNSKQWDTLLNHFPKATIFHTSAWAKTLINAYKFKPFYCAWIINNTPIALIPIMQVKTLTGKLKGVSLPFSDECAPLISSISNWNEFFKQILTLGKKQKWKTIEFRGGSDVILNQPPSSQYLGHTIDLGKDEKELFSSFRDSNKRNIKKALKQGVVVTHEDSLEAIKKFYNLNCLTHKKHGIPPQPWNFFEKIYLNIISKNLGFVTIAHHKGIPVASNVYFESNQGVFYKYGASNKKHSALRASNLVMADAITKCKELKKEYIHFGRTDLNHLGLLQYKRGFGVTEFPIKYYTYDLINCKWISHKKTSSFMYTGLQRLISKIPLFLLKIIGNFGYRFAG